MGKSAACQARPCTAQLLGNVGYTTVEHDDTTTSPATHLKIGEDIYGPYEAGFSERQNNILSGLGCDDPTKGHVEGGIDTRTADGMIAANCAVAMPRYDSSNRYEVVF